MLSFAGGADCFNVPDLLRSGMKTVTVCSDLLKSGGYMRMLQYFETLNAAMDDSGATDLSDFVAKTAPQQTNFKNFGALLREDFSDHIKLSLDDSQVDALVTTVANADGATLEAVAAWADNRGFDADLLGDRVVRGLARLNLRQYAKEVRTEPHLHKQAFDTAHSKTVRELDLFDCIEAPCVDECPVDQAVPQYMEAVRTGDYATAVAITRGDNPIPTILGHVCDHLCEHTCIRTHYDEPLAIREIKRFIMSQEVEPDPEVVAANGRPPVAIIGAGPAGLATAGRLAEAGHPVTVFEMYPYAGGMVGGAIPTYRLPQAVIDQDLAPLERLGVEFRFGMKAGEDFTLESLRADGYEAIVVAVGAQLAKRLGLDGEEAAGIEDGIGFLRSVREGDPMPIGTKVAVIGAGDTAMDCARTAWRLGSEVTVVYRRTIDQMPADREEIRELLHEGIKVEELAKPAELAIEDGKLAGLVCTRMEFRGDRDSSGRKIPHEVPGSEFTLPFDTMLLAISQHSVLDFFGDEMPELTDRGYLKADPETMETCASLATDSKRPERSAFPRRDC
jgi:NADPH-dependent glutamate synthase beta subunit-like oxidoreductase